LESFYHEKAEKSDLASSLSNNNEDFITIDSDDESFSIDLPQDITSWYSECLKQLKTSYPKAFDLIVNDVMARNPSRKRNAHKNVLGKWYSQQIKVYLSISNLFFYLFQTNSIFVEYYI
jgi:hypothetical protein